MRWEGFENGGIGDDFPSPAAIVFSSLNSVGDVSPAVEKAVSVDRPNSLRVSEKNPDCVPRKSWDGSRRFVAIPVENSGCTLSVRLSVGQT